MAGESRERGGSPHRQQPHGHRRPDPQPSRAPADDNAMIRGMVERLAARLREKGADVNGWIMLVRSYLVLGERERAEAAAAAARAAVGSNGDERRRLDEGLKTLGLRG